MSVAAISPPGNIQAILDAVPAGGLFAEKEWRISPEPFPLSPRTFREIETLGVRLHRFQRAANEIYFRSVKGSLPAWIHEYLDRGKPGPVIEYGRSKATREELPAVLRPDLILTEDGLTLTEIDSVPGGIGLTGWLNETYANLTGAELIGGTDGVFRGFASLFPEGEADIIVSQESSGYRPEMEWLAGRLADHGLAAEVRDAETYAPKDSRPVYRFLELFDLPNIPGATSLAKVAAAGGTRVTSPFKAFLDEKLWLALFWMRPLQKVWQRELRDSHWKKLQEIIPYGWVVDPSPLPHHAVIPRLELGDFRELAELSQKERSLVLKLSGFSELAWGSRSVRIGDDLSQGNWAAAVNEAIAHFAVSPYVLQEFHKGRLVEHPYWDAETGKMETMEGRVRLCPYYFVAPESDEVSLGGVLATICPADKKVLHGMRDAIMVPCRVSEEGY